MTEDNVDFEAMLAQAKLPEDTVPVCLRGDLGAQHQELARQLAEAQQAAERSATGGSDSLADGGIGSILEQMEAVRQQMAAATVPMRLRALGDRKFSAFIALHPPRPEDRRDMIAGYNRQTMGRALIRECLYSPKPTNEQWESMQDVLSTAEWSRLDRAATDLNFTEVSIPFSQAALKNPQSSGSE